MNYRTREATATPVRLMIAIFAIMLLVLTLRVSGEPASAETAPPATSTGSVASPMIGVLLGSWVFDIDERVQVARKLEVAYFRQRVLLSSWDGACVECPAVRGAGLDFVLTVRNTDDVRRPSSLPADLAGYRDDIGRVIDAYRPVIIAVENEENTLTFYSSGAEDYGSQLQVACEAAHSRGIACTNGGLLSVSVKYFVYQRYVDAGMSVRAASYAEKAFEPGQRNRLKDPSFRTRIRERAREVQRYLDAYSNTVVDFLNIHWYHVSGSGLKETVRVLRRVTGLEVVSNEMGQHNLDAGTTRAMLESALDVGMPLVVWYGTDASLARGLVDSDGSLRSTGRAFRSVIRSL